MCGANSAEAMESGSCLTSLSRQSAAFFLTAGVALGLTSTLCTSTCSALMSSIPDTLAMDVRAREVCASLWEDTRSLRMEFTIRFIMESPALRRRLMAT